MAVSSLIDFLFTVPTLAVEESCCSRPTGCVIPVILRVYILHSSFFIPPAPERVVSVLRLCHHCLCRAKYTFAKTWIPKVWGGGLFGWCRLWHLVNFDNDIFFSSWLLAGLWSTVGRRGGGPDMDRISLIVGRTFLHEDPHRKNGVQLTIKTRLTFRTFIKLTV